MCITTQIFIMMFEPQMRSMMQCRSTRMLIELIIVKRFITRTHHPSYRNPTQPKVRQWITNDDQDSKNIKYLTRHYQGGGL